MFELSFIFKSFIFGFIVSLIYEVIRFFKKQTQELVFTHILIDLTFFYFAISYIFINQNLMVYGNGFIYVLGFAVSGFYLESTSLHFLIDNVFQFVYTKIRNVLHLLRISKLGKKIFK